MASRGLRASDLMMVKISRALLNRLVRACHVEEKFSCRSKLIVPNGCYEP